MLKRWHQLVIARQSETERDRGRMSEREGDWERAATLVSVRVARLKISVGLFEILYRFLRSRQKKKQLLALQREVILDLLAIFIMTLRDALCGCGGGFFINSNWRSLFFVFLFWPEWETVRGNTLSICILARNVKHVLHFGATRLPRGVAAGDRQLKEGQGMWYLWLYKQKIVKNSAKQGRSHKMKLKSNISLYLIRSYRLSFIL